MLHKQLSPSGSSPQWHTLSLTTSNYTLFWDIHVMPFTRACFMAPWSLLISFLQLDITLPKLENESFPRRAGVELISLAPARCDTKPESMESLKFSGVKSQRHGWVSSTKQVKHPGCQVIWHFQGVAGLRLLCVLLISVLRKNQILVSKLSWGGCNLTLFLTSKHYLNW